MSTFKITVYYDVLIVLWSVPASRYHEKHKMKQLKVFLCFLPF